MIIAEEKFRRRRRTVLIRRTKETRGCSAKRCTSFSAIKPVTQVGVEPRDINANRTLIHATSATGAQFGEASVLELACSCFPSAANAAGVGFATERVAANGLEISAGIKASAAANAVERFAKHGGFAHFHAAIVDQHQMELAFLGRLSGKQKNGIGERWAKKAGIDGEALSRSAGGQELDKRSHFPAGRDDFLDAGDGDVHRREKA